MPYRVTIKYRNGRTQVISPGPKYNGDYRRLVDTVAGGQPVKYSFQKKL